MLEEFLIKVFGILFVYAFSLHWVLLLAREKEEDFMVPFSFKHYSKMNLFGKVFIIPIVFVMDMIAWIEILIIGLFIFLFNKIFFIGKKESNLQVA